MLIILLTFLFSMLTLLIGILILKYQFNVSQLSNCKFLAVSLVLICCFLIVLTN